MHVAYEAVYVSHRAVGTRASKSTVVGMWHDAEQDSQSQAFTHPSLILANNGTSVLSGQL